MFRQSRRNLLLMSALALIASPLLTGAGCPPPNGGNGGDGGGGGGGGTTPTTLLSTTQNNTTPVTFSPSAAGKLVAVTVTGNVSNSRPAVLVRDNLNATVAQEFNVTTPSTTVSFTTTTTGNHTVFIFEFGTPPPTYTILVTEQ